MAQGPAAPSGRDGLPVLAFADAAALQAWITGPGAQVGGVWVMIAKKASGEVTVTYPQLVEVALRHGWIDGERGRWDDRFHLQRLTPRRPGSAWSRINREAVERLDAAGLMAPAGLAAVAEAKRRGAWERAYEPASTATVPDDLRAALDAEPAAAAAFAALDGANRYAVLFRVAEAKRAATRTQRIERFVALLARGEVLHPGPGAAPQPASPAASRDSSAAPAASSTSPGSTTTG